MNVVSSVCELHPLKFDELIAIIPLNLMHIPAEDTSPGYEADCSMRNDGRSVPP